jgi:hypothetical protein
MRRFELSVLGAVASLLATLITACDDPVSTHPSTPNDPRVISLQLGGPSSISPGQSAQFVANVRLTDGTIKSSPSTAVRWRSSNASVLQVNESGFVTAGTTMGDAMITAEVVPTPSIRATQEVLIIPDGTFRVVGVVRDADPPHPAITGARIEVAGASIVGTTGGDGQYRLYGVPPAAELRAAANGFHPVVQNIQINAHSTFNFNLAASGPRPTLQGPFTLAIDVIAPCTGTPTLPEPLKHRTYEASATTRGSLVDVRLTEPRFVTTFNQGNAFFGRSDPGRVTFTLGGLFTSYYYYAYYPNISERLQDGTVLVPEGTVITRPADGGVSGTMSGSIVHYASTFPSFSSAVLGRCTSSGIEFKLTPRS